MRWITVTLDATDTPKSIYTLGGAIFLTGGAYERKFQNIDRIVIYPESGNNAGANGPARVGGSDVDRVAAGDDLMPNGVPLIPGIHDTQTFASTGGGVYSFREIYISGESGDVFTIGFLHR